MKKTVALFLAVFLSAQTAFAATGIDLKALTTDELLELRSAVSQELADRGDFKSATVPAGTYTVGNDIPAGSYSVSTSQVLVTVTVNSYEQMYAITPENRVGKMTLKEGDTLTTTSTVVLEQYSGLTFE